jgi:hypothetical protein
MFKSNKGIDRKKTFNRRPDIKPKTLGRKTVKGTKMETAQEAEAARRGINDASARRFIGSTSNSNCPIYS